MNFFLVERFEFGQCIYCCLILAVTTITICTSLSSSNGYYYCCCVIIEDCYYCSLTIGLLIFSIDSNDVYNLT